MKIAEDLYFSPEAIERARQLCAEFLDKNGPASMAQLRDAWGVSRKFSVPLCEFFDANGLTIRNGDLRVAGPRLAVAWG